MKKLIFVSMLLATSASMASTCSSGWSKVYSCASAPAAGDYEVATQFLDSVMICQKGSDSQMVIEKNGESAAYPAQYIGRVGGVSYVVESDDLSISLSLGGIPRKEMTAKLYIDFAATRGSEDRVVPYSTFKCKVKASR